MIDFDEGVGRAFTFGIMRLFFFCWLIGLWFKEAGLLIFFIVVEEAGEGM